MTSELRELVTVPIASACSMTTTSRPDKASALATASPTTPAPATTQSIACMGPPPEFGAGKKTLAPPDPDASYAEIARQRNDTRRRPVGKAAKPVRLADRLCRIERGHTQGFGKVEP